MLVLELFFIVDDELVEIVIVGKMYIFFIFYFIDCFEERYYLEIGVFNFVVDGGFYIVD